jgi:lysozyme
MQASDKIKAFIKKQEGFMPRAYLDPPENSRGLYSIGYGHQIQPTEKPLRARVLSEQEASQMFDRDLQVYVNAVNASLKRNVNQSQFDALVDLAYNAGTSAAAKVINTWNTTGDSTRTINHLALYNKANGVVNPTLVKRRALEAGMFDSLVTIGTEVAKKKA